MKTLPVALLMFCLLPQTFAGSIEIQGHRGARGLRPENTMPGFREAAALGVDVLELDVGMSSDGIPVVAHDPIPNPDFTRIRGGGGYISFPLPPLHQMTFSRIQAFDVGKIRPGSPYFFRFPRQKPVRDTPMPSLHSLLNWLTSAPYPTLRLNIEIKTDPLHPELTAPPGDIARAVLRLVKAAGFESRASIQSFDFRAIMTARAEAPSIPLACLTSEDSREDTIQRGKPGQSPWLGGLDVDDFDGSVPRTVKEAGCSIWSPRYLDVTRDSLAEAKRLGLRVIVWTVNSEAAMKRLARLGVDGIITDYPNRALKALRF